MSFDKRKKKAAKRPRRTVTEREGAPALSVTAKSALCALPVTVAVGLLLLCILSALLLKTADPDRYHTAAGLAALYVTACLGGMIAIRLNRRRAPLLCGLGEGLLLLLFMTVLGLFLPNGWEHQRSVGIDLLTRLLLFPASLIGAFLAARQPKRHRHRR